MPDLTVRRLTDCNGCMQMVLCDGEGRLLPAQRGLTLSSAVGGMPVVMVELYADGNRLEMQLDREAVR